MSAVTVSSLFPHAVPMDALFGAARDELSALGFTADNAIACVSTCRDELTRDVHDLAHAAWGEAFNFSSLAGMVLLGRTGFGAAISHAPTNYDRERFVFVSSGHVGVHATGGVGVCERSGRTDLTTACGALCVVQGKLEEPYEKRLDPADIEVSLILRRLAAMVPRGKRPELVKLTELAHDASVADLEALIERDLDPAKADWAVITGIQVHASEGELFAPRAAYAMVSGERRELSFSQRPLVNAAVNVALDEHVE